jgi:hypothetical protein
VPGFETAKIERASHVRKNTPESEGPTARQRPSSGPSRGPTDGVLSEILKRLVEAGAKNLSAEPMRQLLSDMKLPGDALFHVLSQHLLVQLEETKQNVYRLVSRELKGVMERTNVADELASALTKLSLEVTMQVRFSPRTGDAPSVRFKTTSRDDAQSAEPTASTAERGATDRSASAERASAGDDFRAGTDFRAGSDSRAGTREK